MSIINGKAGKAGKAALPKFSVRYVNPNSTREGGGADYAQLLALPYLNIFVIRLLVSLYNLQPSAAKLALFTAIYKDCKNRTRLLQNFKNLMSL